LTPSTVARSVTYPITKRPNSIFRKADRALLSRTGAAYLVTHSQSGPLDWHVADESPDLVSLKSFLTELWYS
jgi:hypothetical protein